MERHRGDRWLAADGNLTPAQTLASRFKVAALNYTEVNYRRTFGRAGGFGGIGISSVGQSYCRSHVVPSSICRTLPPRLQPRSRIIIRNQSLVLLSGVAHVAQLWVKPGGMCSVVRHGVGFWLKHKLCTGKDGKTCFSHSDSESDATATRFNSGNL